MPPPKTETQQSSSRPNAAPSPVVKPRKGINSVEIGYRLLAGFTNSTEPLSLKQLAAAADMTSAKAYFYLTSFTRIGLTVKLDQGALYKLGPAAIHLGLTALSQLDALQKARDAIAQARSRSTQSVFISVMGSHGPNVIYRMQGAHWSVYEVRLGAILPRISSTGRALMASLPVEDMLESLEKDRISKAEFGTPYRSISRAEALKLCKDVHVHGIALGGSIVTPDFASVAAPIYDHDGNVSCAITLVGYRGDIDLDYDGEDARRVLTLCRRLSEEMGWSGQRPITR